MAIFRRLCNISCCIRSFRLHVVRVNSAETIARLDDIGLTHTQIDLFSISTLIVKMLIYKCSCELMMDVIVA